VPRSGGPASSLTPDPHVSYPWGTTFTINEGAWGTSASPGVAITPDSFTYQWQRCDDSAVCSVIQGATGKTYTSTANDVGYHIAGFVQAHRNAPNASSSDLIEADETFTIIEKTPVNTALPRILGSAVVGTTLQSTAGAWDAHSPTFTRRWLRCGADGLDCQPLQPDQTGTTYTLTDADVGSTIELEVTATQADPSQNRVTVADSKPTAVVTKPSSPPPPPTPPAIKLAKPHKVSVGTKLHGPRSVSGFTIVGYQWLRNGKAIKGATKSTYKITRKDRGKKISLRLTLKRVADGATFTVVSSAIKVPKAHKKHHRHRHHHRHR
jgi:hypothetical protein